MSKNMNVPKLRFKEFDKKWQNFRIDSILERYSNPVKVEKNINYRELGVRSHGKGIFHKELTNYDELGNKRVFWVHTNAFIINIVFAWEQAIALTSENETGLIASHRFPMYIPKNNLIDLKYLLYYFLKPYGKHLLGLASPGGAGRNKTLGQSNFNELKIRIPSKQEQEKIASFLTSVDTKIEQLSRKEELLQQYKKGVMQKIFSQEIRFKADDGSEFPEWEEKKLGDIIDFLSDYTANGSFASLKENVTYYNEENYAVLVRTTDLEKKVFRPERFTDKRGYDFLKKTSLFGGEIILANVGSIGKVYKVPTFNKPMTLAPNTYVISFNKETNEDFIFQVMNIQTFTNKLLSMVGSSTLKAINKANLRSIIIDFPSLEEQTKIANFLSSIDSKIEQVQKQLNSTKEFKKALLQQMFV